MHPIQRLELPGAIYYLQLKGSAHRELFTEQHECLHIRELLAKLCDESGGQILGFCLLHDSIHLVLATPADGRMNCVEMGQQLIAGYSKYYNESRGRSGSVFHDHFPTVLIDPKHFLLPVIHKLHRLPVANGLVPEATAYPWSSHRDYLSPEPPWWLNRDAAFRRTANHRAMQMRRYEMLINENPSEDIDWVSGNHTKYRALASSHYIEKVIAQHELQEKPATVDLTTLTHWVCREYGLSIQDLSLWRRHRLIHEVRAMVTAIAIQAEYAELQQVAEFFNCDSDLLDTGTRAIESHRGMYLHHLQLKLERELNSELAGFDPNGNGETLGFRTTTSTIHGRIDDHGTFNQSIA